MAKKVDINVIKKFRDKYDRETIYEPGTSLSVDKDRARDLVARGLAQLAANKPAQEYLSVNDQDLVADAGNAEEQVQAAGEPEKDPGIDLSGELDAEEDPAADTDSSDADTTKKVKGQKKVR